MNTLRVILQIVGMTYTVIREGTLPIAGHIRVPKNPGKSSPRLAIRNEVRNYLKQGMKQGLKTRISHEKKEFLVNAPTKNEDETTEVVRGDLHDATTKTVHL